VSGFTHQIDLFKIILGDLQTQKRPIITDPRDLGRDERDFGSIYLAL